MNWFAFMLTMSAALGMVLLIVAHTSHKRICDRRGLTPQAFPLPLFVVLAVLFAVTLFMGQ